jgi:cytochrome c551/c552
MRKLGLLFLILGVLVAACGGGGGATATPAAAPTSTAAATATSASGGGAVGDAAAGEALFKQSTIDSDPGCSTCHSLQPDQVLVGPSLAGIANSAADFVPGESAEQYLRQSILDPNAYVVEGFPSGVMPQNFGDVLSSQQIDDLVAFLLTLK